MAKDDQRQTQGRTAADGTEAAPASARNRALQAVAFFLVAVGGLTLILCLRSPLQSGASAGAVDWKAKPLSSPVFQWAKPDLAVVLTGQQHGYLQPCGCSEPQLGGLARRYNFVQALRQRGWPVVALDLGDVPPEGGNTPQSMLKYTLSMNALKEMGYTAVGVGAYEMRMQLLDVLSRFALNEPSPRLLAANLHDRDKEPYSVVKAFQVGGAGPKVGVVGVVSPVVAAKVQDPDVSFDPLHKNPQLLPRVLKEVQAARPDLLVLLYQGNQNEARACAKHYPQFHVILHLDEQEEPSGTPEKVGNTLLIGIGHKGRYAGVLGVYRTGQAGQPYRLKYQMVGLDKEYETPPGKESANPVMAFMENYSKEVKAEQFLEKAPRSSHPVQVDFPKATYVGSERCKKCHEVAYKIWKESPHSHAYSTLEKARRPSLRQYDPDCVACHVTGFGYKGGFVNEVETPKLRDNGCENCHGPCSEHVKNQYDEKLYALINPYKAKPNETAADRTKRMGLIDQSCIKCHDSDNDSNWIHVPFEEKWVKRKIIHMTPK
jgi:hypothetical protein